jgi:ABC-2 type transport system ATP-binding protein
MTRSPKTHFLSYTPHVIPRPRRCRTLISHDAMIRIAGLRVLYGSFAAVDGLDLEIRRGELFGLLGPNGAGKSTTIRVLIGQRLPSGGHVSIAGLDVVREWAKIKPLFGYVPDRENHFEEFTGRRNLEFFAQLYATPRLRVNDVLKMVELDEQADLQVRGYSLGMRKKLLLARALLHEPPILYLDEPTANLDIHSAEVVHRILRERVKDGATIVMTTHDMDEVEKICDRVGIVCRGKLVALDSPLALKQEHTERKVDVIRDDGERLVFDVASEAGRRDLAALVTASRAASIRTREFDFHATFLKLTGQAFE